MKREPNISWIDYGRGRRWWVRIQRVGEDGVKRVTQACFSVLKLGGKRKALDAARRWRDRTLPGLPRSRRRNLLVAPAGHGYVRRVEMPGRDGERHPRWIAWIRLEGGRNRSTSRSVGVWGERGAKKAAERWLEAQRAEIAARAAKRKGKPA